MDGCVRLSLNSADGDVALYTEPVDTIAHPAFKYDNPYVRAYTSKQVYLPRSTAEVLLGAGHVRTAPPVAVQLHPQMAASGAALPPIIICAYNNAAVDYRLRQLAVRGDPAILVHCACGSSTRKSADGHVCLIGKEASQTFHFDANRPILDICPAIRTNQNADVVVLNVSAAEDSQDPDVWNEANRIAKYQPVRNPGLLAGLSTALLFCIFIGGVLLVRKWRRAFSRNTLNCRLCT